MLKLDRFSCSQRICLKRDPPVLHRCHKHPTQTDYQFQSTFSAMVIPQILMKYFLHASHDLLVHSGATKLYHFLKKALVMYGSAG